MRLLQNLLALGLWFSVTSAAASAKTVQKCYTKRATNSIRPVPTQSKVTAWTLPQLALTTYTPSVVKTPSKVTTTTTIQSIITNTITLPVSTDTFTSYSSVTTTITVDVPLSTISVYSTETETITSGTDTSVVPTATGFLPSKDTVENAESFSAKKRSVSRVERGLLDLLFGKIGITSNTKQKSLDLSRKGKASYPSAVICYQKVLSFQVYTITRTAKSTTTITASVPTSIVTTTSKTTSTVTLTPPVGSTTITLTQSITETITNAPSTTITISVSETVTIPEATTTSYAACNADNSVGKANGATIINTYYDPTTQDLAFTEDADMNSCCTSCFSTPGCAMFQLITFNSPPEKCMLILTSNTCALPNTVGANSVSVDSSASASDTIVVGNGICGIFDQVG